MGSQTKSGFVIFRTGEGGGKVGNNEQFLQIMNELKAA
jgi:hypothetical protein